MRERIGAILLVAGTCIGSGMIALPMVLSKLGLIQSIILMVLVWLLMYYTSLINIELNLQAGQSMPLGLLGRFFSGPIAELLGSVSLKLLSYGLLAVFIYGATSVTQKLIIFSFDKNFSSLAISSYYAICSFLILLLPVRIIDYINRVLFIILITIFVVLTIGLITLIDLEKLPLSNWEGLASLPYVIPVVFTSFGFQLIFHTLTNYTRRNKETLKSVFFWGSIIPLLVYITWTVGVLSAIYKVNPAFYKQMSLGQADVGDLIREISKLAKIGHIQTLIWYLSLFAIVTSILGVSVGLMDSTASVLMNYTHSKKTTKYLASFITIFPSFLVAVLIPNAFIMILGFAGMILAIIAILLPVYLLKKANIKEYNYAILKNNLLIILSALAGIMVIVCELIS